MPAGVLLLGDGRRNDTRRGGVVGGAIRSRSAIVVQAHDIAGETLHGGVEPREVAWGRGHGRGSSLHAGAARGGRGTVAPRVLEVAGWEGKSGHIRGDRLR